MTTMQSAELILAIQSLEMMFRIRLLARNIGSTAAGSRR
jgi:hypothetical protein